MTADDTVDPGSSIDVSRRVWWGGIAFASLVTFVVFGGTLLLVSSLVEQLFRIEIPYLVLLTLAAMGTAVLVRTALGHGTSTYRPSE